MSAHFVTAHRRLANARSRGQVDTRTFVSGARWLRVAPCNCPCATLHSASRTTLIVPFVTCGIVITPFQACPMRLTALDDRPCFMFACVRLGHVGGAE